MAKLSISKAWDETREVIARNGSLLTTVALAMFVLPGVVSDLVSPPATPGEFPKLGYWTVVTAITLLIALVGQLGVIRLAIGSRLTVGEAIGHGAKRAPAYLAASLIWLMPFLVIATLLVRTALQAPQARSPVAGLGIIVLVCVMLFFAIRMLMTSPVASAEPVGPLAIIRRSWDMTRGNWWRLFGFFLLFLVAVVIAVIAVGAVGGVIAELVFGGMEPLTVGALFVALLSQLVTAVVSVLLMVMLARIYVQLAGERGAEASVPTTGS